MIERITGVFTPKVRAWMYGIGAAAVPVTVIYGVLTVEQGGAWLALVGAVLGSTELMVAGRVTSVQSKNEE